MDLIMRFKFFKALALTLFSLFVLALPTQAEPESWQALDVRIPIAENPSVWVPQRVNAFAISQLAPRFDGGLGVLRFSVGPQWDLAPQFSLAVLGDVIYLGHPSGQSTQEYRFNLEPTWRGKFSPELSWLDRTRLEYRQFPGRGHWRARNLFRLNWQGLSPDWIPYLANEIFLEYPQGFNQNRAFVGVRHVFNSSQQVDLGYMWRARLGAHQLWEHDHILMLFFFFSPQDYTEETAKEADK